ncbi:MAG TPA: hypothetical protein VFE22_03105 [Edaphobacter sp.]|nr:hypothetical protein [Edaphobacter sp.]
MKFYRLSMVMGLSVLSGMAAAQGMKCNIDDYKPVAGIRAEVNGEATILTWQGEGGQQLRAEFTLKNGQPVVQELAARAAGGTWSVLGRDLSPDFEVTSGMRRSYPAAVSVQMKKLKIDSPERAEGQPKWNAFWDAPLWTQGDPNEKEHGGENAAIHPDEIKRAKVSYTSNACKVTTDGDRVSITFNGLTLGIFAGDLRFTAYKGSNLLRQEAIAKTEQPATAYIYKAGLKGFTIGNDTKLVWRDTAQEWQKYEFGGAPNNEQVNLRARNRLEILDAPRGSLAIFPAPHKFFFARENEVNLGYVYYRKDNAGSFSLGIMQPEHGEGYVPWGMTDEIWNKRVFTSHKQWRNYALYNAPPGSLQHMAVYYYLSAKGDRATQQAVLAYTHDDVFKPISGFKVLSGHFHLDFNEQLRDRGTLDYRPSWVPVFRSLGINILYLGDFHDDSDPRDPGPKRFMEQKVYFEGAQRVSDKDFLVIPAEEPNAYLGGHWYLMTPRPVYFSHAVPRPKNQSFEEQDPTYGHVYHLGSAADVFEMVKRENGIIWTAHPRTKSSELYPDGYKDKDFFLSDRFVGASWESLPADLSQQRLCEVRCFGTEDDMSNWAPKPKFMIAEGDTYTKWPSDETYPYLAVNYLKLDRVPSYSDSWAPITESIRRGDFFGTTGEILFHHWGVEGTGTKRTYTASIEYTFPLEFAEVVWGNGTTVDRKIIKLTDTTPFGTKNFSIPFDVTGKKWVRFAVWDSAGDGAWTQPVGLKP